MRFSAIVGVLEYTEALLRVRWRRLNWARLWRCGGSESAIVRVEEGTDIVRITREPGKIGGTGGEVVVVVVREVGRIVTKSVVPCAD